LTSSARAESHPGTRAPIAERATSWDVAPVVLVRGTGFPFEHLDRLRLREPAVAEARGNGGSSHASFDAAVEVLRENLHALASDPRFQEAVFLSNPRFHAGALGSYVRRFDPARRPSETRRTERKLYSYVQRFCAKNETTSFFGPIGYGYLDPSGPPAVDVVVTEDLIERNTRLAYWAADAIGRVIAEQDDVWPALEPRLQYGLRREDDGALALVPSGRRLRLDADERAVVRAIDGRPAREIVGRTGPLRDALARLVSRRVVRLGFDIPTATFDAGAWLRRALEALPAGSESGTTWSRELGWFETAFRAFELAPLAEKVRLFHEAERRFTLLTGREATRADATLYGDRTVVNDDAVGLVSRFSVGGSVAGDLIGELSPVFDLCAAYSRAVQGVCLRRAVELHRSLGGGPQPFLAFTRALDEKISVQQCRADRSVRAFVDELARIVAEAAGDGGEAQLCAEDVEPLLGEVTPGTPVSPDVLIDAGDVDDLRTGLCRLVLGEIHYGVQVWTQFLEPSGPRSALDDWLESVFAPAEARAGLVFGRHQGKMFPLELPGYAVEVLGRSTKHRERVIAGADLDVVERPGPALMVRPRQGETELSLYPGDPRAVSNWVFGPPPVVKPPLDIRPHAPRASIGRVVVWRRRWTALGDELIPRRDTPYDLWRGVDSARRELSLPERVFARTGRERKPLFVDFLSPFAVELLASKVAAEDEVELTECLPDPGRWWLRGRGGRYGSELRMSAVAVRR
jgi:hypothetical protein